MERLYHVAVAGHICFDIIPQIPDTGIKDIAIFCCTQNANVVRCVRILSIDKQGEKYEHEQMQIR